jgi:hypothetical protein
VRNPSSYDYIYERVRNMLEAGWIQLDIAKHLNVPIATVGHAIATWEGKKYITSLYFGHKNQPYYEEDYEYQTPTYDELSPDEQYIYRSIDFTANQGQGHKTP